jgi:hypothetical protein
MQREVVRRRSSRRHPGSNSPLVDSGCNSGAGAGLWIYGHRRRRYGQAAEPRDGPEGEAAGRNPVAARAKICRTSALNCQSFFIRVSRTSRAVRSCRMRLTADRARGSMCGPAAAHRRGQVDDGASGGVRTDDHRSSRSYTAADGR